MNENIEMKIHRINCLISDMDAIYHQAALKLGMSDSAMYVMYMICYKGDGCPLSDIREENGISKQTINSALRKLEADGILYMEPGEARTKRVRLTEKGREYAAQTGARLFAAECSAFNDWTEEEIDLYLNLIAKYTLSLSAQIDRL